MPKKEYYTAQEAMQKLGLAKSTFYDYVRDGRIPKPQLPPYKQRGGMFSIKEIDELANAMKGFITQYNEAKDAYVFRIAKIEDAPALSKFSWKVFERFGGYGMDVDKLVEWFKAPQLEIGHILFHNDQIVGYFTILPLKHEQTMQILRREVRPSKIPVSELPALEPGNPIDLFIVDVAVDPDRKQVGAHLIGKLLSYFHELGRQGIEIEGIYATTATREGTNLCRRVGMKQMDLPNIEPTWIPFEMKIQETVNTWTEDYLKALRSFKRKRQKLKV